MSNNTSNDFGLTIRQLRTRRGWSLAVMAEKLNISTPAYYKIEDGTTGLKLHRIEEISKVFSVQVADLIVTFDPNMALDHERERDQYKLTIDTVNQAYTELLAKHVELIGHVRANGLKW